MTFASLFDGIYGFGLGLEAAGMECVCRVELSDYPTRVTCGWRPGTKHKRDVRKTSGTRFRGVGLLCGGFPCQDLSVAGKRKGLAGKRSGLFHELVRICDEARPRWLLWENVPGLLSSNDGRDFWTVNAALAEIGYFGAWRVLDSQHFGVAQRRRRVFGLYAEGYSGAMRSAAVLLEPESGGWHPAEGGGAGQGDRWAPAGGAGESGGEGGGIDGVAGCLSPGAHPDGLNGQDAYNNSLVPVSPTLRAMGRAASFPEDRPLIASAIAASAGHHGHSSPRGDGSDNLIADTVGTLVARGRHGFQDADSAGAGHIVPCLRSNPYDDSDAKHGCQKLVLAPTLSTKNEVASSSTQREKWMETSVETTGTVRRLTPTECEKLQGFPPGWTIPADKWEGYLLPKGLDSARYRALGNAVTTNVVYWIGLRIMAMERLLEELCAIRDAVAEQRMAQVEMAVTDEKREEVA